MNSKIKELTTQYKTVETHAIVLQKEIEKLQSTQEEKLRDLEMTLFQEKEIFMKRLDNFKRNQATMKTEKEIFKDLEDNSEKLKAKLSMIQMDIERKQQKLQE